MTPRMRSASGLALATALLLALLPAGSSSAQVPEDVPKAPSNLICDNLDPALCMLPFPNDFFTVADSTTPTGRRVEFSLDAMPRNGTEVTQGGEGKPTDPTEWNRQDGFSPGSMVMTYVPGIDLHATWGTQDRPHSEVGPNELGYFDHRDTIADPALSLAADAPMVIINAETGERHPFWAELDTHPLSVEAGEQVLILRPATNFEEGTRYIVGLRDLKDAAGNAISPRAEFEAYKSGTGADPARQTHFDQDVFPALADAGVAEEDLYLAWDFTIASEQNLSERMLHMRDDAFGRILGDADLADREVDGSAPGFFVDSTENRTDSWTDSRGVSHVQQIRRVHGRVTVPNYLDRIQQTEGHFKANDTVNAPVAGSSYDVPAPGSRLLDLDLDGLPDQNPVEPTVNVPFMCDVVISQDGTATDPRIPMLYGHGLLGTRSQLGDLKSPRRDGPFMGCAADWWGMSSPDLPTVAATIADMSLFPSLPDRAQQGFLNFMFLGRALVHPDGFATAPEFQSAGQSLVATDSPDDGKQTQLHYDGNSQGGIMGGSLVAVSPDISRGILGVPGINYSTLLNRSVDWEGLYAIPFYEAYRDPIERQLVFALIQMLWDRGEANGYAHHMTDDPYANTPPHEVMLQVAWSDHQVTNHAAEVEARTIGAPIMQPGLPEGRHWEMDPYFTDTAQYPYKGSSLIYWDSGNATPPNGNIPADQNGDPHGHPRNEPAASWQEAHFLLTGWNVDVCEGQDYLTDDHAAVRNGERGRCRAPDYAAGTVEPEPTESPSPTPTETPTESPTEDPTPATTALDFTDRSAEAGQFSDATLFEATLSEDASGQPVAGAEVVFELLGPDGSRSFSATTNDQGVAAVTPTLTERPGESYQLFARYAGDADRSGAANTHGFVVAKEDSASELAVAGKGNKQTLNARLADADSDAPIAGRSIQFFADGEPIGSSQTNENGRASIAVPPKLRGGGHEFEARFVGDDYYAGSAAGVSS